MKLIPDSSFFICFFDDLKPLIEKENRLMYFGKVVNNFDVKITQIVFSEVRFEIGFESLLKNIELLNLEAINNNMVIEAMRPLWSKGEFEVICSAYNYKTNGDDNFIFIIDDLNARKIIFTYLDELKEFLKGTIGFIVYCTNQKIFEHEIAINILISIRKSKFRVDKHIIDDAIIEIEGRKANADKDK